MLATRQGAELAIDKRDEFTRQVVGIVAYRRRIDVLVAAECRVAVREDHDGRAHFLLVYQSCYTLWNIVAERFPVRM